MTARSLVVASLLLAGLSQSSRVAHADAIDDLVAKGEDHAKKAEWSLAIDAFKQADQTRPRAKHACLIALAYTRKEAWPQAEIFFDLCHKRASASDPLPTWVGAAEKQLGEKLAQVQIAAVTIAVTPADAAAKVAVSSFGLDETFAPRVIHLAPGKHAIEVSAAGFVTQNREVVVVGRDAQTVAFALVKVGPVGDPGKGKDPAVTDPTHVADPTTGPTNPTNPTGPDLGKPLPPGPPIATASHSNVPKYVLYAGAGIGVLGVVSHLRMGYEHNQLQDAVDHNDPAAYMAHSQPYDDARNMTKLLYATATVTLAVGVILKYTLFKDPEGVQVGAAPTPGGGLVTFAWSR